MSFLAIEARLENTPENWQRSVFKRVFAPVERRAEGSGAPRLSLASAGFLYPREGGVDRQMASEATEARSWMLEPGDLVINPMWLIGGGIAVSRLAGAVSPDYRVFRPTPSVHPRFAHHLLRSRPYMAQYGLFVRANTTFDRRVSQVDLDSMPVVLPPPDEQRRIADFLDDRVERIDRIISARREQVAKLAQVREARIQQLQDELVRRHGECRLGYLLAGLEQGWSPQADSTPAAQHEWGVMRSGCVNGGLFRPEDNKRLPDGLDPRTEYEIRSGDLLMSRASGSLDLIGSVAVVPPDVRTQLLLCDKIYRVSPVTGWDVNYLAHMMRTRRSREHLRLGVSGAEGMANNLPSSVVRDLRIPIAPIEEQAKAGTAAEAILERESLAAAGIHQSIKLLAEYKASVVTVAVTGEVDVATLKGRIPG